jgi:hypothetical protein
VDDSPVVGEDHAMRPNAAPRSSAISYVCAIAVVATFGGACGKRSSLESTRSGDAGSPDVGEPYDGPPDGAWVPVSFAQRLAAAACEAVAQCCTGAGLPHDVKACRSMMASRLTGRVPSEVNPFVTYDAEAEKACLLAVAQTIGQCRGPSVYWGFTSEPVRTTCARVLNGSKPAGAPCTGADECDQSAGLTVCDPGADGATRCTLWSTPVPSPQASVRQIGETCHASSNLEVCNSDCAPGTFCDTDGKCAAKHATGPCTDLCRNACSDGNYCDATSTCRSKVPLGGDCPFSSACQGPDAFCASGKCVPELLDLCTDGP